MSTTVNSVATEAAGTYMLVRVAGEVDLSWSQQVRRAVLDALASGQPVAVDLSAVGYIDSSGIAALVEGLQGARARRQPFVLVAVSAPVRAVLELARLDSVFALAASADAAFAAS
ncbi:MAG: STAS domain-containing protein [Xanthomonadales bacterium]|nr:STAS domain-containing protein [Xanthomonadales bacterium]